MARVDLKTSENPDATAVDLSRLLKRLDHTVLAPSADQSLRYSSYERTKVGAVGCSFPSPAQLRNLLTYLQNLEYARTLLLRLEHDNSSPTHAKYQQQKNAYQTDLKGKRALIKQIQDRLYELNQLDDGDNSDGYASNDPNAEDLLDRYAPAIKDTSNSVDTDGDGLETVGQPSQVQMAAAAATLSSTLRSRRAAQEPVNDTAFSTGTSSDLLPRKPSAPNTSTSPFAPASSKQPDTSANDVLLEHHSSEQEALTSSLLTLAQALKASTLSFADSLEASNPLVDRASEALDGNVKGMEAAGLRMGMLRKMTEGRGWWSRLTLYAKIAVLAVVALVIVFILPKLRF